MKRGQGVHTVPGPKGWVNKLNGTVACRFAAKDAAVAAGRALARSKQVEHTIHRRNGRISQKNSYGNDPCPPRDGR
jgi:hypothetical protein